MLVLNVAGITEENTMAVPSAISRFVRQALILIFGLALIQWPILGAP